MNDVDKLMDALKTINQLMTEDVLKEATTEQLLEYNELINQIKALIISGL